MLRGKISQFCMPIVVLHRYSVIKRRYSILGTARKRRKLLWLRQLARKEDPELIVKPGHQRKHKNHPFMISFPGNVRAICVIPKYRYWRNAFHGLEVTQNKALSYECNKEITQAEIPLEGSYNIWEGLMQYMLFHALGILKHLF